MKTERTRKRRPGWEPAEPDLTLGVAQSHCPGTITIPATESIHPTHQHSHSLTHSLIYLRIRFVNLKAVQSGETHAF